MYKDLIVIKGINILEKKSKLGLADQWDIGTRIRSSAVKRDLDKILVRAKEETILSQLIKTIINVLNGETKLAGLVGFIEEIIAFWKIHGVFRVRQLGLEGLPHVRSDHFYIFYHLNNYNDSNHLSLDLNNNLNLSWLTSPKTNKKASMSHTLSCPLTILCCNVCKPLWPSS